MRDIYETLICFLAQVCSTRLYASWRVVVRRSLRAPRLNLDMRQKSLAGWI